MCLSSTLLVEEIKNLINDEKVVFGHFVGQFQQIINHHAAFHFIFGGDGVGVLRDGLHAVEHFPKFGANFIEGKVGARVDVNQDGLVGHHFKSDAFSPLEDGIFVQLVLPCASFATQLYTFAHEHAAVAISRSNYRRERG